MRNVVVTGVSTGIGSGTTSVLIRRGWHVFGTIRTPADASALVARHGGAFTPLIVDVEDGDAIIAAAGAVRTRLEGRTLHGLVNNAGSSFPDPLLVQSVADFRRQIEINLVGMFAVTRAFAPLLGADPALDGDKGRIVNVSSVGGRMGPPFLGAYAAAKHGVEGFSESLRRELRSIGIDVVIVAPGSVATAVWDKAEAMPRGHLAGTPWEGPFGRFTEWMIRNGRQGLSPEQVGTVIADALTVARPRTRYAPIKGRFMNATVPSLLPRRVLDRLIGQQLGLRPAK